VTLAAVEDWTRTLGAIISLASLSYAAVAMLKSLRRPAGREDRGARIILRAPVLLTATVLFLWVGYMLWRPLQVQMQPWLRVMLLPLAILLFFGGLALYLWGLRSLREMFGPSTSFAVRLHAGHRLITSGPYAYIRHPMYLAVIITAIGSVLLYRTWATLAFTIAMFGLPIRARREENVLAEEFGPEWEAYATRVPMWLPRFGPDPNRGA